MPSHSRRWVWIQHSGISLKEPSLNITLTVCTRFPPLQSSSHRQRISLRTACTGNGQGLFLSQQLCLALLCLLILLGCVHVGDSLWDSAQMNPNLTFMPKKIDSSFGLRRITQEAFQPPSLKWGGEETPLSVSDTICGVLYQADSSLLHNCLYVSAGHRWEHQFQNNEGCERV